MKVDEFLNFLRGIDKTFWFHRSNVIPEFYTWVNRGVINQSTITINEDGECFVNGSKLNHFVVSTNDVKLLYVDIFDSKLSGRKSVSIQQTHDIIGEL